MEVSDALSQLKVVGLEAYLYAEKPLTILGGTKISELSGGMQLRSNHFSITWDDTQQWVVIIGFGQAPLRWVIGSLSEAVSIIIKYFSEGDVDTKAVEKHFLAASLPLQKHGFSTQYFDDDIPRLVATRVNPTENNKYHWFSILKKGAFYIVISQYPKQGLRLLMTSENLDEVITFICEHE